ncbi:RNA polymerase sigma factor [Brevibacillus borstelensis]|uniref:RNA polymerase sigma factor n=1 Tax=Brevibacillus borstelensis TaxID=45462 RepID=UPI0030C0390E
MYEKQSLEQQIMENYHKYFKEIYQMMLFFTGDSHNAEDLTQEVFVRVLKALPSFQERSGMRTWIFKVARNVAIDEYRKKRLRTLFSPDLFKILPSTNGLPEQELQIKETREYIQKALLKLNSHHRLVIILRGLKEYSVKETAEILGCSEAKIKVDFHRALKKLRGTVEESMKGARTIELS